MKSTGAANLSCKDPLFSAFCQAWYARLRRHCSKLQPEPRAARAFGAAWALHSGGGEEPLWLGSQAAEAQCLGQGPFRPGLLAPLGPGSLGVFHLKSCIRCQEPLVANLAPSSKDTYIYIYTIIYIYMWVFLLGAPAAGCLCVSNFGVFTADGVWPLLEQ